MHQGHDGDQSKTKKGARGEVARVRAVQTDSLVTNTLRFVFHIVTPHQHVE